MIQECLSRALEGLQEMKEREGQAMQSDIQQRLSSCGNIVNSIEKLSQAEPERFRDRLQERFSQLTEGY